MGALNVFCMSLVAGPTHCLLISYVIMSLLTWLSIWTNHPFAHRQFSASLLDSLCDNRWLQAHLINDWHLASAWIRILRWAKIKLSNARPGDKPVDSYALSWTRPPVFAQQHRGEEWPITNSCCRKQIMFCSGEGRGLSGRRNFFPTLFRAAANVNCLA